MSDYYLTKKDGKQFQQMTRLLMVHFSMASHLRRFFAILHVNQDYLKKKTSLFSIVRRKLSHGYRACKRCKSGGSALPDTEWVNNIEMYIKENFAKALTLKIIADDCHGSPYHLHRTFKRITMITPITYLENVRINYAKMQLTTANQSIETIGKMAGFPNPSHFSTTFKRHTGLSPNQFRKTIIKKLN